MRAQLPTSTEVHPVRRSLQLRRLISVQRAAIRRAHEHGESRGTVARLQDHLRRLEIEMRDVEHLLDRTPRRWVS
jgi:hypothetical protein